MTKVTTSKQLIEEYHSIQKHSVVFGKWLMKKKVNYKFHRCNEDLYFFPDTPLIVHTMKELFEMYEYENNKHLIHK